MKVMRSFLFIMVTSIISGYIVSLLLKNNPIRTAEQIRRITGKATDSLA